MLYSMLPAYMRLARFCLLLNKSVPSACMLSMPPVHHHQEARPPAGRMQALSGTCTARRKP